MRKPIVAGRFYPGEASACRAALDDYLTTSLRQADLPAYLCGGIVPHAGWMCSGRVTGQVFAALAEQCRPQTVVLLGAVHRWPGERAAVFPSGSWTTPLGDAEIDEELAEVMIRHSAFLVAEPQAHAEEHSLEVQVPFVQHVFASARIVPVMVAPSARAAEVGTAVAQAIVETGRRALVLGTTDLTHYGPTYAFTPYGADEKGLRWAKEVNDVRLIRLIEQMSANEIVPEAMRRHNACGPGAVAAAIAAAAGLKADRAVVLAHTTSGEVLGSPDDDAVGYVGVVFGNN